MKTLWAPWRAEYLSNSSDNGDDCVFCEIGRCREKDEENFVLYRKAGFFVLLNRYPYINGHLMIVPEEHIPDLSAIQREDRITLMDLCVLCEKALKDGMNCMGLNGGWNIGGCAGAGIEGHVHIHMLPRWAGDVNFMSTLGNTRVMSESLESTYKKLRPYFNDGKE